ncbi:MAG TPA: hypothetical protein VHO94_04315 [Oscillospiraceae bacterium]|nr:hypothetical protein [Oscillospiraceae bacterium]
MDNKDSRYTILSRPEDTNNVPSLEQAVNELQKEKSQAFQQLNNIPNMPIDSTPNARYMRPSSVTKLEEIIEQNKILKKANSEIFKMLDSDEKRIQSLETEVTDIKNIQKHDTRRTILISLGCAIVGAFLAAAFTIIAFKCGLLK